MLSSLILLAVTFVILAITGFVVAGKAYSAAWGVPGIILGLVASVALLALLLGGGVNGDFGYNTYKEITTTNFTKALTKDHSSVIIMYDGRPYVFTQFNIVHNYESITNILIYEKRSVFNIQTEFNIKIVTPPYQEL